jgi:hypothetical protein
MKWEYATAITEDGNVKLNDYGEQGWEVCSMLMTGGVVSVFFKRPKQEDNTELVKEILGKEKCDYCNGKGENLIFKRTINKSVRETCTKCNGEGYIKHI